MHKTKFGLVLSVFLVGTAAMAAEQQTATTTTTTTEVTRGYLNDQIVGIKPEWGVIAFTDGVVGNTQGRMSEGIGLDWNIVPVIDKTYRDIFVGPSTGFVYSHLGDPGSNFVGTNTATPVGTGGANLLMIPADLKVGYTFMNNFQIAAHGGGNVIYRSVGSSMALGSSSATTGPVWRIFPNVGADLEVGVAKNVSVLLRPDWTITPGNNFFTGTVGLGILLS